MVMVRFITGRSARVGYTGYGAVRMLRYGTVRCGVGVPPGVGVFVFVAP